jgi:hypothetical protein
MLSLLLIMSTAVPVQFEDLVLLDCRHVGTRETPFV